MKQILCLGLCCLTLTACSNINHSPDKTEPRNDQRTPEQRANRLTSLDKWNLRGQIAVNNGKEAWSAQVVWQQRAKNFTMQLYGPFAGGTMKIAGTPDAVTLTDASNQPIKAASADELFTQQTGWNLPISNMLYWVKATPVPGKPAIKIYDKYNHLTKLEQQGWQITYPRYTSDNGIDLPSRIQMLNRPLKIKIVISDWKLLNENPNRP